MPRVLALLLVAAVLIWGVAMSDLRGARGTAPGAAELPDEAPDGEEIDDDAPSGPAPARVTVEREAVEAKARTPQDEPAEPRAERMPDGEGDEQQARQAETLERIKRAAQAPGDDERSADEPDPTQRGEAYASPDFRDAARAFGAEPRHVIWAPAMERSVRDLLREAGQEERIEILNCRQTVCRLQIQVDDDFDWEGLLAIPGLQERTTLTSDTPISQRAGVLTVHFGDGAPAE